MRHVIAILTLCAGAAVAWPAPPTATDEEIRALVKQLGSEDYGQREAAARRLDAIGAPAIAALRLARRADDPEIVRRAGELLRRIEHRAANEKALAPTLVELDAKDQRLDDVLAQLSRQAGCEVVLNGAKVRALADRKITVRTGTKVPFWQAVQQVCEAGELAIGSVGGFLAPGAHPLRMSQGEVGVRLARNADRTVVLEARGDRKRGPTVIFGAVMVEALEYPEKAARTEDGPSALLQVWPEPRLNWQATTGVKIGTALAAGGSKLAAEPVVFEPSPPAVKRRGDIVMVRNPDGTARFVEERLAFEVAGGFRPSVRQSVLRFRAAQRPETLQELDATLYGTIRSGIEALCVAGGLEAGKPVSGKGVPGVELTATYHRRGAGFIADVTITFDRRTVHPAGVGEDLSGITGAAPGLGNQSVQGIRFTDANGKAYTPGVSSGMSRSSPDGREMIALSLHLYPGKDGNGPPHTVTFWGSYARPVEVPVVLKGVPLTSRKPEK